MNVSKDARAVRQALRAKPDRTMVVRCYSEIEAVLIEASLTASERERVRFEWATSEIGDPESTGLRRRGGGAHSAERALSVDPGMAPVDRPR